jgi:peptidoglycan/LPS O-acetylase OafA/YrhL
MGGFILASMYIFTLTQYKISWNLPGQLQFFMVGFLLADLRIAGSRTSRWWDAASLFAWLLIFLLPIQLNNLALPGLILVAYLGAFNGPAARRIFRRKWIALTGGMCYSFYLMHMLVISAVFKWSKHLMVSNFMLSFLIQTVVLGAFIYVFCTAYFVLIERPCMDPKWPQKLLRPLSVSGRLPSEHLQPVTDSLDRPSLATKSASNSSEPALFELVSPEPATSQKNSTTSARQK